MQMERNSIVSLLPVLLTLVLFISCEQQQPEPTVPEREGSVRQIEEPPAAPLRQDGQLADLPVRIPPEHLFKQRYGQGLNLYRQGEYYKAIQNFKLLLENPAVPSLADNVRYWTGECFYAMEDYLRAIMEFRRVLCYWDGNKAEDALYKLALSYMKLRHPWRALAYLETLEWRYPESHLISRARELHTEITDFWWIYSEQYGGGISEDDYTHLSRPMDPVQSLVRSAFSGQYRRAMDLYRDGEYGRAVPMLERIVQHAGDPDLRALARYWLIQYHR